MLCHMIAVGIAAALWSWAIPYASALEKQEPKGTLANDIQETRIEQHQKRERAEEKLKKTRETKQEPAQSTLERASEDLEATLEDVRRALRPKNGEDLAEEVRQTLVPEPRRTTRIPKNVILEAGVAINNLTGDLGDEINPGPGFSLRAGLNNDNWVGAEFSYMATLNPQENANDADEWVMSNEGNAQVRLNWRNQSILQPFMTGGVGLTRYNSWTETDLRLPGRREIDNEDALVMTVPLGIGVQFFPVGAFTASGRLDYRFQTDAIDNQIPDGDQWAVGFNLGATF